MRCFTNSLVISIAFALFGCGGGSSSSDSSVEKPPIPTPTPPSLEIPELGSHCKAVLPDTSEQVNLDTLAQEIVESTPEQWQSPDFTHDCRLASVNDGLSQIATKADLSHPYLITLLDYLVFIPPADRYNKAIEELSATLEKISQLEEFFVVNNETAKAQEAYLNVLRSYASAEGLQNHFSQHKKNLRLLFESLTTDESQNLTRYHYLVYRSLQAINLFTDYATNNNTLREQLLEDIALHQSLLNFGEHKNAIIDQQTWPVRWVADTLAKRFLLLGSDSETSTIDQQIRELAEVHINQNPLIERDFNRITEDYLTNTGKRLQLCDTTFSGFCTQSKAAVPQLTIPEPIYTDDTQLSSFTQAILAGQAHCNDLKEHHVEEIGHAMQFLAHSPSTDHTKITRLASCFNYAAQWASTNEQFVVISNAMLELSQLDMFLTQTELFELYLHAWSSLAETHPDAFEQEEQYRELKLIALKQMDWTPHFQVMASIINRISEQGSTLQQQSTIWELQNALTHYFPIQGYTDYNATEFRNSLLNLGHALSLELTPNNSTIYWLYQIYENMYDTVVAATTSSQLLTEEKEKLEKQLIEVTNHFSTHPSSRIVKGIFSNSFAEYDFASAECNDANSVICAPMQARTAKEALPQYMKCSSNVTLRSQKLSAQQTIDTCNDIAQVEYRYHSMLETGKQPSSPLNAPQKTQILVFNFPDTYNDWRLEQSCNGAVYDGCFAPTLFYPYSNRTLEDGSLEIAVDLDQSSGKVPFAAQGYVANIWKFDMNAGHQRRTFPDGVTALSTGIEYYITWENNFPFELRLPPSDDKLTLAGAFSEPCDCGYERDYNNAYLLVRFLYEEDKAALLSLLNHYRSGDDAAFESQRKQIESTKESHWQSWLQVLEQKNQNQAVLKAFYDSPRAPITH
ncbi:collagenase [Ferrimonas aestuarii]|uniref:Uncharacterized protein n=1 Tax=Ferrimonas aestuarii TaxID=2569539 RepID=A0A4V5NVX0_9GAMM|nr:collagenase [Ferrimonas aestuarii]TKB53246.1 hypothetical protein FCL42_14325 [Ferrimonas aestuarii]